MNKTVYILYIPMKYKVCKQVIHQILVGNRNTDEKPALPELWFPWMWAFSHNGCLEGVLNVCGVEDNGVYVLINSPNLLLKWQNSFTTMKILHKSMASALIEDKVCLNYKIIMSKSRIITNPSIESSTFPYNLPHCKTLWWAKADEEKLHRRQKTAKGPKGDLE